MKKIVSSFLYVHKDIEEKLLRYLLNKDIKNIKIITYTDKNSLENLEKIKELFDVSIEICCDKLIM